MQRIRAFRRYHQEVADHAQPTWLVFGGWSYTRQKRLQLVSVKAAKELALRSGKTDEDFAHLLENKHGPGVLSLEYYSIRWVQRASVLPPLERLLTVLLNANVLNDRFCGVASIPLPSLTDLN